MLPKENRLTKKKDFDRVWQAKKGVFQSLFGVKTAPNDLGKIRFGVIVSLKVSKKAVIRNRVKRRIRAVAINNLNRLKSGQDIIVIALPKIAEAESGAIKNELETALNRLNLLK